MKDAKRIPSRIWELLDSNAIDDFQKTVFKINENHGWHDEERSDGDYIALIHSELSECLEAFRHGNPSSEHIPNFSGMEEELADAIIRILDYAEMRGLDVANALIAKMDFNDRRPYRHGGKKL